MADHPLLEARHVDDLVEAVHALNRTMTQALDLQRRQLHELQIIAQQTRGLDDLHEGIKAVRALVEHRANGSAEEP